MSGSRIGLSKTDTALWGLVTVVLICGWIFWGSHWKATGWDFTMFYVAAHTAIQSIHDPNAFQETAQRVLAGTGVKYASPYVRPAVFALALRWMRGMSYWEAYRIWACFQFGFYAATLWLLAKRVQVPVVEFYPWAVFFPAFFGIITGQDSLGVGFVLCLGAFMLAQGQDKVGGAILSLTLYKFNLFLLLPIYLVVKKRYSAVIIYALSALALAGMSALLEPPEVYFRLLPDIQKYTIGFSASTMLGLRGLCAAVGYEAAYPIAALAFATFLLIKARKMEFLAGFGLTVLACVLCAYHVTWYDGAVLALPLGFALRENNVSKVLASMLLTIPFWNVLPSAVTVLLLLFALSYTQTHRPDLTFSNAKCREQRGAEM